MGPERTMHFIGVDTAGSSSLQLFAGWAEVLGIHRARLVGHDVPLNPDPALYRATVDAIADDPAIAGALVTTHKVGIHAAAADRFQELDPLARLCGEISCISKRGGWLIGHAKDPATAGQALTGMIGPDHFRRTGGQVICLGAGGAGVAIAVHFLAHADPARCPDRMVVTDTSPQRLATVREVAERSGAGRPELLTAPASRTAALIESAPPGSLVINATGMGKDVPGSPLGAGTPFPRDAIVWDLNYRGKLTFLDTARAQQADRNLTVFDGWLYFLHGWSEHMAEVFDVDVTPATFEEFRRVSDEWRRGRPARSES